MRNGTIQKIITLFKEALHGLGAGVSPTQLEALAAMVHEAMTVQARSFHTPEHIFELSDASHPIQALAALFHDVVYYEIDQGFTPDIQRVLAPYIQETDGQLSLTEGVSRKDVLYYLTLDIFGYRPGQLLVPAQGQNEFLSALLMNEKLNGTVSVRDLVKVTACIEATIPFRGRNAEGESPAEVLESRLQRVSFDYALPLSRAEIEEAVRQAVAFSNRDVENFSERDTGRFLDNTWKLLPETNPSLRHTGIYTITSYRRALQRMEAFLNQLDPETVFNQYRDEPSPGQYQRMVALAHRNVHTGRQYLGLKLLAIGLLEGLAMVSGGDAPVALLMGGIEDAEDARRMEDLLPDVSSVPSVDESSTLFGLLAFGRASSSSFDMQNSPLSLFLFKVLGWEHARQLLGQAKLMFDDQIDAATFLERIPASVVVPVAKASAELASTRRATLMAYAEMRLRVAGLQPAIHRS